MDNVILDTGPFVALIHRNDQHHAWATERVADLFPPFLTCEAVLSEAYFLLGPIPNARKQMIGLVASGMVQVRFNFAENVEPVATLLNRYANVPMSFADACLVRMCEQITRSILFTTDADFKVYRKHGRQVIPAIMPGRAQ